MSLSKRSVFTALLAFAVCLSVFLIAWTRPVEVRSGLKRIQNKANAEELKAASALLNVDMEKFASTASTLRLGARILIFRWEDGVVCAMTKYCPTLIAYQLDDHSSISALYNLPPYVYISDKIIVTVASRSGGRSETSSLALDFFLIDDCHYNRLLCWLPATEIWVSVMPPNIRWHIAIE